MTGLDSLAQAAGRCNREGRLDKGRFVAFRPEDETLSGHFLQVVGAAETALREHADEPFHPEAFHAYFKALYWTKGEDALDGYEMRKLLRLGAELKDALRQGIQFRTAAENFRMIDDAQETVIVPFDTKARQAIARLRATGAERGALRALQRYTVPVRRDCLARLDEASAIEDIDGIAVLVREELYHPDTGIDCEAIMDMSIEKLMI
jgi:CRISPR-associated endonuclease/helicase Cas3